MRRITVVFILLHSVAFANIDSTKMVESIRIVENSTKIGRAGERGPWQILPSVWRQYSKRPLAWASSKQSACVAEQKRVVLAHIHWIREQLRTINLPDTPRSIALIWGAGFENVRRETIKPEKLDYADRAQNIYESLR
jgi:hypothetical protein